MGFVYKVRLFRLNIKPVFLLFFLGKTFVSFSQTVNVKDTLVYYTQNYKPKLIGGFHNRNAFISSIPIKVYGARIGVEYGEKISFNFGLYTTFKVGTQTTIKDTDTIKKSRTFNYASLSAEYTFYNRGRWNFAFPIMLGMGAGFKETTTNGILSEKNSFFIMPIETGVKAHYSILDWLGAESTLGIRLSPLNASEFNGSFYSFGVNIYLGKIYNIIKEQKGFENLP
jgi:hypothetical protein